MPDVEPFPFATVEQLKAKWKNHPVADDDTFQLELEDASQFILDVCGSAANAAPATRRRVVIEVVRRSMQVDEDVPAGLESIQQGAGPYQATWKPINPGGDYYLTKNEKIALGCKGQRAFSIDLLAGHDDQG